MSWTKDDISKFSKEYGDLTVEQALELNKIAKETCGLESTAETGDVHENI